MDKLYIAFVDTPGFFASIIRMVVKMNYVHTVLSLDDTLLEAYSIGRRNPEIPILAGFEKENLVRIHKKFPSAKYKLTYIECTSEQKENIRKYMKKCYNNRYKFHYCIVGLLFLLIKKPFYHKNYYTCSSFICRTLEMNGIKLFDKHFSLVTPRDFFDLNLPVLYEGSISPLVKKYIHAKKKSEFQFSFSEKKLGGIRCQIVTVLKKIKKNFAKVE